MPISSRMRQFAATFLPLVAAAVVLLSLGGLFHTPRAEAAPKYASIVIDHYTGRVLYSRHADARRYPASLTKIMTLYMLFEQMKAGKVKLDTRFRFSKHAASQPPSKLGFKPGQSIRVFDAIRALVTKSANDVAVAIAENLAGSEAEFARRMTKKARLMGMSKTTFRNASGLPDSKQVTTARDMATLSRRIMEDFPDYYPYFKLKYFKFKGKRYRNHNGLLFTYKGTDGIKTGYIRASGFNLAASVKRSKKHLVAVVMGGKTAKSRNHTMQVLLNRALPKAVTKKNAPKRPSAPPAPLRNPLQRKPVAVASASSALPVPAGTVLSDQDPSRMLNPPLPAPVPDTPQGAYHVQVGAYSSQTEAVERLHAVQKKAGKVVEGHPPITMPVPNPKRHLFRARFAGFSEPAARAACGKLKSRSIPCIVMPAQ